MMKTKVALFIRSKAVQVIVVSETVQEFMGVRYYLCDRYFQKDGKRLHVAVWEEANGPTPKGWHVHHKDENKTNNQLSNLEALPGSEHLSQHMSEPDRVALSRESIEVARLAASEWHGSQEGRDWHSRHYHENIAHLKEDLRDLVCDECGDPYQISMIWQKNSKYCSNKCRAAARRKSGVDDEQRICAQCQNPFTTNKYTKIKTCSHKCSVDLRWGRK
jgi:hypothetical protein